MSLFESETGTGKEQRIEGHLLRLYFENRENGFAAGSFQLSNSKKRINVRGPICGLKEGQNALLLGSFEEHPRFGRQFLVKDYELRRVKGKAAVRTYLASGLIKGIGPQLAARIVEHFGEEALEIIEEEPERLEEVPGIGKKKAHELRMRLDEQKGLREVLLFLHGHELPANLAARILECYGKDAPRLLQENPYRLTEDMVGVGFKRADEVAGKLGIESDSPERQMAGLLYSLSQSVKRKGHCCLPRSKLLASAAEILQLDPESLGASLSELHSRRRIIIEKLPGLPILTEEEEERVYPLVLHVAELGFSAAIENMLARSSPLAKGQDGMALRSWEASRRFTLEDGQRRAIELALESPICVLTGGPGVGKTSIIRAICDILESRGTEVRLAAPTGRAARRMSEASGRAALTLHRLLEFQPGTNRFLRNERNPLDPGLVVVDESSMLDQVLAYNLIRAMGQKTRLLLVGDVDQLPSVGPGNVLQDLIESSRVPVARLTEIFRQAKGSSIVENAHRILTGEFPILPDVEDSSSDFYFLEHNNPDKALEVLTKLVIERIPQAFGFDPVTEIQVLSPMYRGSLGVDRINHELGKRMNPEGKEVLRASRRFRVGDKVMQIVNNYQLELFNGDGGRLEELDLEASKARVRFGTRLVDFTFDQLEQLVPAYGITVHRSQGSEYPALVLALDRAHYMLLTRRLLYTAVTRAKNLLVLVGSRWALERAIGNNEESSRYTGLSERLKAAGLGDGIHPGQWNA